MPELIVRKWDGPYSFMIFREHGVYKARRGDTGEIQFEDPDAATVIQQAANTLVNGGKILLKAGVYKITSTINLPYGVSLEGEGGYDVDVEKATVLDASSLADKVISVEYTAGAGIRSVQISRLAIKGDRTSNSIGIYVRHQIWGGIRDVEIRYFDYGVKLENTYGFVIDNCGIYSSAVAGVWVGEDADGHNSTGLILTNSEVAPADGGWAVYIKKSYNDFIVNNWFESYATADLGGIYVTNARGTKIIGNVFGGFHGPAININSIKAVVANNVIRLITDSNGALVFDGAYTIVNGNHIEDTADGNGILGSDSAHKCVISNNVVYESDKSGIVFAGSYSVITGNIVFNNAQAGNYDGIRLNPTCTYTVIAGNVVGDDQADKTQNYGIHEFTGADYNRIESNLIDGYIDAAIAIVGTNTVVKHNQGFVTEEGGTATIPNGSTSVVVSHGCDYTPNPEDIDVHPIESLGAASYWWVDTITSSQFTIHVNADPGQDVDFKWSVRRI